MRGNQRLIAAALLLDTSFGMCTAEINALSADELHNRCLAYLEAPQSEVARSCGDYIQGFLAGSPKVTLRARDREQPRHESFAERATRTRLGLQRAPRPRYCINTETSLQEFVMKLLAHAKALPPDEGASSSVLLYGVLGRHYKCSFEYSPNLR
jgi:hypothetical protein